MADDNPEVVPEKLRNPINFKVIAVIAIIVIGFHILVNTSENSDSFVYGFSMFIPLLVSVFAFITMTKYSGTIVYSKAYLMLGIAFLLMFFAELTYFIYEQILYLDPYPSIADVFFFVFYPMIIGYLIINLRFFAVKIQKNTIGLICGVPLIITLVYVYLTISDFGSFDFYYGIIFVAAASITLGIALQTARIFKGGLIGTAWLVLVIGIILNAFGDTWYYYTEVIDEYSLSDPVNLCWYAAYLLILYALFKHKKAL